MKRDGIKFRRCNHLTARYADPERDVDAEGNPIHSGYTVPVRVKDCQVTSGGLILRDSIKKAPCLSNLTMSRTNMAYGSWRRQTQGRRDWVRLDSDYLSDGERNFYERHPEHVQQTQGTAWVPIWKEVYWTKAVYWVEDGNVYHGTIHRFGDPKEIQS